MIGFDLQNIQTCLQALLGSTLCLFQLGRQTTEGEIKVKQVTFHAPVVSVFTLTGLVERSQVKRIVPHQRGSKAFWTAPSDSHQKQSAALGLT